MHSKKADGQQWSIRAEFTVSPQEVGAPGKSTPSTSIQDKSEIRLSYSWKTNENANNIGDIRNYQSMRNDPCRPPIEYQKGNLTFTSTPPCRLQSASRGNNLEVHDSGYGSDLLSLNSLASGSSNCPSNPNNRRCRSTCSIVLSSNVCDKVEQNPTTSGYGKCGRINSLRCQTPALHAISQNANFYGCGDPWCHHIIRAEDDNLSKEKISSAVEQIAPHQVKNAPPGLDYKNVTGCKPYKRDVSIQTSDSLQKCSVANLGEKKLSKGFEQISPKSCNRNSCRYGQYSSSTGHAGEKLQTSSSGKPIVDKNCEISGHTSDSSKKSRTIHIDVYCTDTEIEPSETSSDSWENESTSTPQTVFESENMSVTHERARQSSLPFKLKKYLRRKPSTPLTSIDRDDSDNDDGSSTNYPSKIGSYSTINDFSSSISSIKSWKNNSLSSFINDGDSIDNFSKTSIFSSTDRPLSYKRANSFGRKFIPHGIRKSVDEANTYKSNQQSIDQKPPQGYEKCIPKRQNPDGSDSHIKINVEEEKYRNIPKTNKEKKPIAECGNVSSVSGIDPCHSNKVHSSIKSDEKVLPFQKLTHDQTTSSHSTLAFFTGQFTEQIASRFGQVINLSKKLGHHTGPAKNPDCDCEHCRRYFGLLS